MEPAQRVSRLSVYFSVLFVFGFLTKSATACSPSCVDFVPAWCALTDIDCSGKSFDMAYCPAKCGICTPCPSPFSCEVGTCVDRSPFACMILKFKNKCHYVQGLCRKTCGLCTPCVFPPDPPSECSADCEDKHPECQQWADSGHCHYSSPFKADVNYLCKKSCDLCFPCA